MYASWRHGPWLLSMTVLSHRTVLQFILVWIYASWRHGRWFLSMTILGQRTVFQFLLVCTTVRHIPACSLVSDDDGLEPPYSMYSPPISISVG